MKCALTGHRDLPADFDVNQLYDLLETVVREGYDTFYCGMARGFDLLALDCLVALAAKYRLHLIACIPYEGQENGFSYEMRKRYLRLLEWCDEKIVLSPTYRFGCYHARDRYMVDHTDLVIAYCTRDSGGTAYTLAYAKKQGKEIRFLEEN